MIALRKNLAIQTMKNTLVIAICCSVLALTARVVEGESRREGFGAERARSTFTFKRGVNISHWVSQNEGPNSYAASWFGEADMEWISKHGFDHIRLAVDFRECIRADWTIDETKFRPVDAAIRWARDRGLGVVLDAHFLPGADFGNGGDGRAFVNPELQNQVADLWERVARRFANEGPWLRFEILNEPVAETNQQLNDFSLRMLAAIRRSNPTRIVYLTSNKWSSFNTVKDLTLPSDPNIAVAVHFYQPIIFTHQQASWVGMNERMPRVEFPGHLEDLKGKVPDQIWTLYENHRDLTVADIDAAFDRLAMWKAAHSSVQDIYLGEFGVYKPADDASKRRWIAAVSSNVEKRGWGWAIWDYNDTFGVRDAKGNPTANYEGLFPAPKNETVSRGLENHPYCID